MCNALLLVASIHFFFFFLLWMLIERNKEHKFCRYCVWTLEMLLHVTQILLKVNQRLCPFKKKKQVHVSWWLIPAEYDREVASFCTKITFCPSLSSSDRSLVWKRNNDLLIPSTPLRLPTPDQLKSTPWPPVPRGENRAVLNSWPHAAVFFQPYCELCPQPLTPLNHPHTLRWR